MKAADPSLESAAVATSLRKLTVIWILTMLGLFPILILLGGWMRTAQGGLLAGVAPDRFYSVLTLHGVGMVGLWYVAAMAGAAWCMSRYVRISPLVNWIAWAGTVVGVALLLVATLVGKFGAGWYFLYPLPFKPLGGWPGWSTAVFFVTLAVLGVTWTVWCLDMVLAIASRYPLPVALGWDLIRGKSKTCEVPPLILIILVSVIAALVGLISAVILLVLYLVESLGGGGPTMRC